MLGFLNRFFSTNASPIGIDFGTDGIKMAQLQQAGGEYKLVAAASADVPPHLRHDIHGRTAFFIQTVRDLLAQGTFKGRQAVLGLPAAFMHIQHLRLPRMDDDATRKALPWELQGKLPIDPNQALMRHIVAGEVYQDQEQKNEVIVMAAPREMVNTYLDAAAKARLDVVGMNVEPVAVCNCFSAVIRRKADPNTVNCFVDIGSSGARVFIARDNRILFARSIPIGGEHFNRATADALKISLEDAKLLRLRLSHYQAAPQQQAAAASVRPSPLARKAAEAVAEADAGEDNSFALLGAGIRAAESSAAHGATAVAEPPRRAVPPASAAPAIAPTGEADDDARRVEAACGEAVSRLVEELDLCRRYYEATFPQNPVDRLVFVGGEARQRALCQRVAQQLGLAAQVGDPVSRLSKNSAVGIESGLDIRQAQPGWMVALGLSLGPGQAADKK